MLAKNFQRSQTLKKKTFVSCRNKNIIKLFRETTSIGYSCNSFIYLYSTSTYLCALGVGVGAGARCDPPYYTISPHLKQNIQTAQDLQKWVHSWPLFLRVKPSLFFQEEREREKETERKRKKKRHDTRYLATTAIHHKNKEKTHGNEDESLSFYIFPYYYWNNSST